MLAAITGFFAAHWVDLFLIVVLAYYAIDGYFRGFILLGLETCGFVLALVLALLGYRFGALILSEQFGIPDMFASAAAFFTLWAAVDLLWPYAVKRLYTRVSEKTKHAEWNSWAGILPGLLNGGLLFSVLLSILLALPVPASLKEQVDTSVVARPLIASASALDRLFHPVFGPLAERGLNLLTVPAESGETLDLKFTVHDGTIDPESEQALFAKVNEARAEAGLKPLRWSDALSDVGRMHSDDMFSRGYFSHVDPDGRSPSDRVEAAGIDYLIVGENLALAPTVSSAHEGLMNSPGHRANILEPSFGSIGIGVIDGGVYGKMFTQVFKD